MELSYAEMQNVLCQTNLNQYPPLNISILRNIMLEPIEPYLRYLAYEIGYNAHIKFGEYDTIFQEAVGDQNNLLYEAIDCILIFMKLDMFSWDLSRNFAALSGEKIESEFNRV